MTQEDFCKLYIKVRDNPVIAELLSEPVKFRGVLDTKGRWQGLDYPGEIIVLPQSQLNMIAFSYYWALRDFDSLTEAVNSFLRLCDIQH
jgi:hypothetical protein